MAISGYSLVCDAAEVMIPRVLIFLMILDEAWHA